MPSSPTDADPARNAPYRDDEYGGLRTFPFASVELCLLAVHPSLVALARTLLRTDDVRIYSAEAWAKYTGAARYEQAHHRDFLNHTVADPERRPCVPQPRAVRVPARGERGTWDRRTWCRRRGPMDLALLPHVSDPGRAHPELYDAEVSAAGPAGTVLAYRGETVHRATELTRARPAPATRLHCSFRPAADEWVGRQGWGDRSFDSLLGAVRQPGLGRAARVLFGFPPPGTPVLDAAHPRGARGPLSRASTRRRGAPK